jgi:hypothetical protein
VGEPKDRSGRSSPQRARVLWAGAAVAVAAVAALALMVAGVDTLEVLATVLFVVVFSVALLAGRAAGFVAAAACTVLYMVLRSGDVDEVGSAAVGLLVLTRGACYFAVAHVTQYVRNRFPDIELPTSWGDDAPRRTVTYAGSNDAAASGDAWPAAGAQSAGAGGGAWDNDIPAAPAAAGASAWGEPNVASDWSPEEQDEPGGWGQPQPEPAMAPGATAAWDQAPAGAYDEWGQPIEQQPAAQGWDDAGDPTQAEPGMAGAAAHDQAPWEVDLDAPADNWVSGRYDAPPAPTMPTGWIDDATSPLGDETIPVGYTGELFISREMQRLGHDPRSGANGAPARMNGGPPTNGIAHPGAGAGPGYGDPSEPGRLPASAAALAPTASMAPVDPGGPPPPGPAPLAGPPPAPGQVGGPDLAATTQMAQIDPHRGAGRGYDQPQGYEQAQGYDRGGNGAGGPDDTGGGFLPMADPSEGVDPETRLWNARFFRERLTVARDEAVQAGTGFSVVMIQVPDQPFQPLPYRRQVALLRELGHQFVQARVVDHLVHLPDAGHHWFAVVLTHSDRAGATSFERRLRNAISGYLRSRGLPIAGIQSLSLTSPDDDQAMEVLWSTLLGPSGGPAMAYDGQA